MVLGGVLGGSDMSKCWLKCENKWKIKVRREKEVFTVVERREVKLGRCPSFVVARDKYFETSRFA